MPKFRIWQYQTYIQSYTVEAENAGDAIAAVIKGEADHDVKNGVEVMRYVDVDEDMGLRVTEVPTSVADRLEALDIPVDGFIPSIESVREMEDWAE